FLGTELYGMYKHVCIGLLLATACGGSGARPATDGGALAGDGGALARDGGALGGDGGVPAPPPPARCATGTPGPLRFRDATADWGLADVRGGRVSVGDLDGDGYPDV